MSNVNKWKKDIQANRQKRADVSYKKYGRKSKSKQQYVQGDLVSSARNRAYGVRKNNTPGYTAEDMDIKAGRSRSNHYKVLKGQNPYEIKYLYDGKRRKVEAGTNAYGEKFDSFYTKKRRLTNQEISNRKETGDIYKSRADKLADKGMRTKYIGADKADPKRTRFGQHLKTFKLDGIETAKNRVRAGMGGKGEYIKGAVKDLIDPFGDVIKMVDYVGGVGSGAIAGAMENATQLFEGTAESKPLKYFDKDLIKKNVESSVKASNTTGSGKFLGDFFNEATKRSVKRNIEQIKNNDNFTEEHKKSLIKQEKLKLSDGKHKMFRTGTGLLGEIAMPGALDLGGKAMKAQAFLAKNAFKSGKDMIKGTGDLATALVPKTTQEFLERSQRQKDVMNRTKAYFDSIKPSKKSNALDVLSENKPMNDLKLYENEAMPTERFLNKGYDVAMAKKEQVKEVVKSNPATSNLGKFLEGLNGSVDQSDDAIYMKSLLTMGEDTGDYTDLFKELDSVKPEVADDMLDWLEINKPDVFNKYLGGLADEVDTHANELIGKTRPVQNTFKAPKDVTHRYEGEFGLNRRLAEMDNFASKDSDIYEAISNKNSMRKLLQDDVKLPTRAPYKELKKEFIKSGYELEDALAKGSKDVSDKISNIVKKYSKIVTKEDRVKAIDEINNLLFGKDVIKNNASKKEITSFVNHLEDLLNYNLAKANGEFSFKVKGNDPTAKNGVHFMRNRNGELNELRPNFNFLSPSLLDETFSDKMSSLSKKFGVKDKSEITKPFNKLKEVVNKSGLERLSKEERDIYDHIKFKRDLTTGEANMKYKLEKKIEELGLKSLSEKEVNEYKTLKSKLDKWKELYDEMKDMDYDEFIEHKAKVFDDDIKNPLGKFYDGLVNKRKLTFEDMRNEAEDLLRADGSLDGLDSKETNKAINHLANQLFDEYKEDMSELKIRNHVQDRNASVVLDEKGRKISQSPRVEQESLESVGELELTAGAKEKVNDEAMRKSHEYKMIKQKEKRVKEWNEKVSKFRKDIGVKEAPVNKAKIKLQKGQKLYDLPPVKQSLTDLRKAIESEMQMMFTNPSKYEQSKDMFKQIKKEYVNSLRSYGVKDKGYFDKVKTLQKDLEDLYTKQGFKKIEKKTPLDVVPSNPEREALLKSSEYKSMSEKEIFERKISSTGGSSPKNDPKFSMNLQLLAKRIEDTFEELGNTVHGTVNKSPLDKIDDVINPNHKKLPNGDIIDTTTGEIVNKTSHEIDESLYNKDYFLKNNEENKRLQNFISMDKEPGITEFTTMFDSMNIKYNLEDEKSMEKAFDKFSWIIEKKIKNGEITPPSVTNKTGNIPNNISTMTENTPLSKISSKVDENKKYLGDDVISFEEKVKMDRESYELIDKFKNANTRAEKEQLYSRLFQQLANREDDSNKLNYIDGLIKYLNEEGGIDTLYKNRIVNKAKQEMLRLANKGIDPQVVDVKSDAFKNLNKSLKANQYSDITNNDVDKATSQASELNRILEKESKRTPNQNILDKIAESNKKPSIVDELKKGKKSKADIRRERRQKEKLERMQNTNNHSEALDKFSEELTIKDMEKQRNRVNRLNELIDNTSDPKKKIQMQRMVNNLESDMKTSSNMFVKNRDEVIKGIANNKKVEPIKKDLTEMLDSDLSVDEIGKSLDEDLTQFETSNKPINKAKEWLNDGEKMFYEGNEPYDIYKSWLNSWKKGLTIYNPGWHMQNFFQNKGQNYMGIGGKAFGSQKKARQLLKYIKGEGNKAQDVVSGRNLKKGIAGTTYTPDDLKKIIEENDVLGGFGEDVAMSRGIFPKLENKVDNSWIMQKLGTNEETARLHHFLTKLERGASPEEAVKSVNKYLYDYSKENKVDKVIKDFVDPFWTFHKNNARMLGQTALENPDRLAKVDKGVRGLQNDVSEEDRTNQQHMDIQLPFGSFKDEKNGDKYDYQYNQTLLPEAKDAIPFENDDIEAKLNPLIQLALQQSRGEGSFHNKIVDGEAGFNEISKDDRTKEIAQTLNPFMKPLVDQYFKAKDHQEKADNGTQSQSTSNKQILFDWLKYITGNKGNYYRDWK